MNEPKWVTDHRGEAKGAFASAATPEPQVILRPSRDSEMVKATSLGLQEGPKPPSAIRHAVKRRAFNDNWRREYLESLQLHAHEMPNRPESEPSKQPKRIYQDFIRASGQNLSR